MKEVFSGLAFPPHSESETSCHAGEIRVVWFDIMYPAMKRNSRASDLPSDFSLISLHRGLATATNRGEGEQLYFS